MLMPDIIKFAAIIVSSVFYVEVSFITVHISALQYPIYYISHILVFQLY